MDSQARTPGNLAQRLQVAIQAAQAAGDILVEGFHSSEIAYDTKSNRNDPVTEFDLRSDRAIVSAIQQSFPHDTVVSEESTGDRTSEIGHWVIDPLDGTNNFTRKIPHVCVSIAYCEHNDPWVACIHDPLRGELYTAIRGAGAYLNKTRLHVSDQAILEGSFLGVGTSVHPCLRQATHRRLPPFLQAARALRSTGSAALDLAYVSAGRFDAVWYPSLHWWDVAAGILLIEEAGGCSSSYDGSPFVGPISSMVASNGQFHNTILELLDGDAIG